MSDIDKNVSLKEALSPGELNSASAILKALRVLKPCFKKSNDAKFRFCHIEDGMVYGSDGVIVLGMPIQLDICSKPNFLHLFDAMGGVEGNLSVTQEHLGSLVLASGDMRAVIECNETLDIKSELDLPTLVVNKNLKPAIKHAFLAANLCKSAKIAGKGVVIKNDICVGISESCIVESYHGLHFDKPMLIPKQAANLIAKRKAELQEVGFSEHSATFYFGDGSIIKTRLVSPDAIQDYSGAFAAWTIHDSETITPAFFKAVKVIDKLSEDGVVHLSGGDVMSTNTMEDKTSFYKIKGFLGNFSIESKLLLAVQSIFETAEFNEDDAEVYFSGSHCRGVALGMKTEGGV